MVQNLIDDYQLWWHPVVLGRGKKLFREGGPRMPMRFVDSQVSAAGLVILTYEPQDQ
jgi:hypothetical protein